MTGSKGARNIIDPSMYDKEPFVKVKAEILKLYPNFSSAKVNKVESQVVAGSNYFVYFSMGGDNYEIEVNVPLPSSIKPVSVIYAKKNGVLVKGHDLNGKNSKGPAPLNTPIVHVQPKASSENVHVKPSSSSKVEPKIMVDPVPVAPKDASKKPKKEPRTIVNPVVPKDASSKTKI